ncbi:MAG: tRNA (guanosine(37)-N1)-methyltransferase TrmD, partial [Bacteroidetes bacterium]|nr:tRNA (guanosine(37)-N1)-methyltransferase TrmD [Bacteroidota bacterium]
MRIDIITVQPALLDSPLNHSMVKRSVDKGFAQINLVNLRDYALNRYGQVDDYQFGGGAGMVLMCEPLANAID